VGFFDPRLKAVWALPYGRSADQFLKTGVINLCRVPPVRRTIRRAHHPVSKKDTKPPTRVSVLEPAYLYVVALNSLGDP